MTPAHRASWARRAAAVLRRLAAALPGTPTAAALTESAAALARRAAQAQLAADIATLDQLTAHRALARALGASHGPRGQACPPGRSNRGDKA